jgi:condensin complex subunit 3
LSKDGTQKQLSGERAFGQKFREAVIYPLGVKKGVEQGDRIIKFIAGFVAFSVDYGESSSTCSLLDGADAMW